MQVVQELFAGDGLTGAAGKDVEQLELVGVSFMGVPLYVMEYFCESISSPPTRMTIGILTSPRVRRRSARTRATNARGENGLTM